VELLTEGPRGSNLLPFAVRVSLLKQHYWIDIGGLPVLCFAGGNSGFEKANALISELIDVGNLHPLPHAARNEPSVVAARAALALASNIYEQSLIFNEQGERVLDCQHFQEPGDRDELVGSSPPTLTKPNNHTLRAANAETV
jgi:hypothetical protein